MGSRRSGIRAALGAVLVTAGLLLSGLPAGAAVVGITIQATVGSCFLHGLGVSEPMTAIIRDGDGKLKGSFPAQLGGAGSWAVDCRAITLLPHDVVRLTDPATKAVLRQLTIPVLTASLDRISGRITGTATGVPSVELSLLLCPVHDDDCTTDDTAVVDIGTDGRWAYQSAEGLLGFHAANIAWTRGFDRVDLFTRAPRLVVTLGSAKIRGTGNPGGPAITVTAKRGTTSAKASARVTARRTFAGTLRRKGAARKLAAGDRIRWSVGGKQQASFPIPAVRAQATTTHITGLCVDGRPVVVFAESPDRSASIGKAGGTEAGGTFDIAWTVTAGWRAWAECQTGKGDVIRTPRVTVR